LSQVSRSASTVLLGAESGSGKELVARALHEASDRASKPYVVFDCAAATPTLIESALFGHEKGAFTGATARKIGVFEEANGGTLFLDEIGELPLELQPRLLRALEAKQVRRLGGDKPVSVDVRLIAATHRDLAREVNEGQFREDLYYRLAVVRLRIPPLRERLDDLPVLVEHLMLQALDGDAPRVEKLLAAMSTAQWERLRAHPWRGNVRELRNAVERSLAMADALSPLSDLKRVDPGTRDPDPVRLNQPFLEQKHALLEAFEARYLQAMVDQHQGNLSRAAAQAGIDRMYFKRLLKKYALPRGAQVK
jgi:DNA-binding NtrC family response regulator